MTVSFQLVSTEEKILFESADPSAVSALIDRSEGGEGDEIAIDTVLVHEDQKYLVTDLRTRFGSAANDGSENGVVLIFNVVQHELMNSY